MTVNSQQSTFSTRANSPNLPCRRAPRRVRVAVSPSIPSLSWWIVAALTSGPQAPEKIRGVLTRSSPHGFLWSSSLRNKQLQLINGRLTVLLIFQNLGFRESGHMWKSLWKSLVFDQDGLHLWPIWPLIGYNWILLWDYTFYKWGYQYLQLAKGHKCIFLQVNHPVFSWSFLLDKVNPAP